MFGHGHNGDAAIRLHTFIIFYLKIDNSFAHNDTFTHMTRVYIYRHCDCDGMTADFWVPGLKSVGGYWPLGIEWGMYGEYVACSTNSGEALFTSYP
jgi:hypothetical protein